MTSYLYELYDDPTTTMSPGLDGRRGSAEQLVQLSSEVDHTASLPSRTLLYLLPSFQLDGRLKLSPDVSAQLTADTGSHRPTLKLQLLSDLHTAVYVGLYTKVIGIGLRDSGV